MNRRVFMLTLCAVGAALPDILAEPAPSTQVTLNIAGMT